MKYLSICSGIEAATVAWHPFGWEPVAFSEIEPFPCAVLAHHYPGVPNLGDMTKINGEQYRDVDVLVGGTPCQAFSIAGLRKGLVDPRGNLTLTFAKLADDMQVPWVVWENVPGVLSSKDNAFGCFLGFLAGETVPLLPPGGRWADAGYVLGPQRAIAWRVLDAQYFGLAQRRRRVFLVACPRNGADPRAILFESEGVRRDTPPCQEARQTAPTIPARSTGGGGLGTDFDCDGGLIVHTLRGEGFDASEDGTGRGTPMVVRAFKVRCGCEGGGKGYLGNDDIAFTISTGADQHLQHGMSVRRFTPCECERLQGFPDDYTRIPWRNKPAEDCPDGPRYKALGNSMAVPCMRWIGQRIQSTLNHI